MILTTVLRINLPIFWVKSFTLVISVARFEKIEDNPLANDSAASAVAADIDILPCSQSL